MFLNEVLAQLESEGFAATPHRIHHAVRTGRLKPRPRKNGLGARIYTRSHLRQLRDYLVNTRRGPRPEWHFRFWRKDLRRRRAERSADRVPLAVERARAVDTSAVRKRMTDVGAHPKFNWERHICPSVWR